MISLTPPAPSHAPASGRRHLDQLDNLRLAVIVLVVVHHAAQAYGPDDWWYVRSGQRTEVLATLSTVGGLFEMNLLFLLAGYLVPASVGRRGRLGFAWQRLKRLGLPFLVGVATLIPPMTYSYYLHHRDLPPISFPRYYRDVFLGLGPEPAGWTGPTWPDLQFGHLWFIQVLLVLSLLHVAGQAALSVVTGSRATTAPTSGIDGAGTGPGTAPGDVAVSGGPGTGGAASNPPHQRVLRGSQVVATCAGFGAAVTAATFVVRLRWPLDTWEALLECIQVEPARLVGYVAHFGAGIVAYRHRWLERLPRATGYGALGAGVAGVAVLFAAGAEQPFFASGGASAASLAWVATETALSIGLSLGLLTLFGDVASRHSGPSRELSAASYALYLVHVPVVVALQRAMSGGRLSALGAFAVVSVGAIAISSALAVVLRRLPGFRAVL